MILLLFACPLLLRLTTETIEVIEKDETGTSIQALATNLQ
jgi:hypothetical protein